MSRIISTENAPAAIGPYVQGVDLGSMIITSGQIPVNPKMVRLLKTFLHRLVSLWKTCRLSLKPLV